MVKIKCENYQIRLSAPLGAPIIVVRGQSTSEAELFFEEKRNSERILSRKAEFDVLRALFKWAETCHADLLEMHNAPHKLQVLLGFTKLESLVTFCRSLEANVSSAVGDDILVKKVSLWNHEKIHLSRLSKYPLSMIVKNLFNVNPLTNS